MVAELYAIAVGLKWAATRGIDLEARIGSGSLLTSQEITALRDALRVNARTGGAVVPLMHYNRCIYVRDYLKWRAQHMVQGLALDDPRFGPARVRLEEFTASFTSKLHKPRAGVREGIAAEAESRLLAVITPGHPDNPFRPKHQHRNHALILLYSQLGIRLSEALVLKGHDLDLQRCQLVVHRRPDDSDDKRADQPLAKTASRLLPLGDEVVRALSAWAHVHRLDKLRYPEAKKIPFLFVSERGMAISKHAVSEIFRSLAKVEGLEGLTCHRLRHRWNDRFSELSDELGLSDAAEQSQRNYQMGWKQNSKMAWVYTQRSTRAEANKSSLKLQEKSFKGQNR